MTKIIRVFILSMMLLSPGAGAYAGIEVLTEANFSSIYMWRGIMLDGDPVAQPAVYICASSEGLGKIKAGAWFSRPLENKDALKSAENDYIFDYTYSFKKVDLSFGHIYYDFLDALPADGAKGGFSREFYWGIAFPEALLAPSIYYYYDYGRKDDGGGEGSYLVLNLSYSKPFTLGKKKMSLEFSGHLGHNNKLYYPGKGGDAGVGAGINIPLAGSLYIKPNINYSMPWGNISDKCNGNQKNRFYSGIYAAYTF